MNEDPGPSKRDTWTHRELEAETGVQTSQEHTLASGHQGLQAAGGERARDPAPTLTPDSQAPDRELPPLWPKAPSLWSRAGPTPPLTTAPDTPGPSTSREAQPGKDGRVSFSSVFMKRSHGSHGQMQAAAGAPSPARARPAPHSSSMTAATVLCPKMKAPTSTETTPQASRQHLPSQRTHVNHALYQSFP